MATSANNNNWKIGSQLQVYSDSQKKWYIGKIVKITIDNEGEWLHIEYGQGINKKVKQIQRLSDYVRPIKLQSIHYILYKFKDEPGIDELTKWIQEWEFDFELVKEDVNEDQELKDKIPLSLFNKIKIFVNNPNRSATTTIITQHNINNDHKSNNQRNFPQQPPNAYDDNNNTDNLQILLNIINKSPRKNAVAILQNKLKDDGYTWDNIVDDVVDGPEDESDILQEFRDNNVDKDFQNLFRYAVYQLNNKISDNNMHDVWHLVLNELKKNKTFTDDLYNHVISYFIENKWTIRLYLENELPIEYSQSQFHDICSDFSDIKRKKLIKIFQSAVIRVSSKPPPPSKQSKPSGVPVSMDDAYPIDLNDDDKKQDEFNRSCNIFVDDDTSKSFLNTCVIIENIHSMINPANIQLIDDNNCIEKDKDLKKLCTVFGINNVLLMNDVRTRQHMIAFCNPDYNIMLDHLQVYEEKQLFIDYVINPKTLRRKKCNESKLKQYCRGFVKLQSIRWLGDSAAAGIIAANRAKDNLNSNDYDDDDDDPNNSDDDDDDDYSSDNDINDDDRIIGSAREAQMYLMSFILGISRSILKNFDLLNCDITLDLMFPKNIRNNKYKIKDVHNYGINKLESLVFQFERIFVDPLWKDTFTRNMKQRKMCIFRIDMCNPKIQPQYCGLSESEIGFKLPSSWRNTYDNIHLFHLMRAKKLFIGSAYNLNHNYRRLGLSFHKFGRSLKYYLIFGGSMLRILPKDIVSWIKYLFLYKTDALKWDDMKDQPLKRYLRDYQALEMTFDPHAERNTYQNQITQWKQITEWSEIDYPYHQKMNEYTKKCRKVLIKQNKKFNYAFKFHCDIMKLNNMHANDDDD